MMLSVPPLVTAPQTSGTAVQHRGGHRHDLRLEPRGRGIHVPLQDVHVRELRRDLAQEREVSPAAVIDRAGHPPGLCQSVLPLRRRRQEIADL